MRRHSRLWIALALSLAPPAWGAEWEALPARSSLQFEAQVERPNADDRTPFISRMTSWSGRIAFDPARPGAAMIEIEIDMRRLAGADRWALDMARGRDWLAAEIHPTAIWRGSGAAPLGGGRYGFPGTLSLRGVEAPLTLEATIVIDGRVARAIGAAALRPLDHGVGARAARGPVGPVVEIAFDLTATRLP